MVVTVVAILKGRVFILFKGQSRKTVPLNQIHLAETVPPFKMDSIGTVPLLKVLSGGTLKF